LNGTCSTHDEKRDGKYILFENLKGREHLRDIGVNERMILKLI
jgi:hypothetical protein